MDFHKISCYKFFYMPAVILLLVLYFYNGTKHEWGGWLLMLFFISLAIAFRK